VLSTAKVLLDLGATESAKDQIEAAQYLIANRDRIEADALSHGSSIGEKPPASDPNPLGGYIEPSRRQ
jgi:hypothetical protein